MDHIEPVEGSQDPEGQQPPSSNISSASRQTLSQPNRPRALSSRTRRPTIRLSRLPSYTLDQVPTQPERGPTTTETNGPRTAAVNASSSDLVSPAASQPADDSWQANRRRSSSEPHRGRYSTATSPNALPKFTVNGQALCRVDESNQSPIGAAVSNSPLPLEDPGAIQHAPMQRRGSRNLLRWTSEAALNRFSRNRVNEEGTHPDAPEDETEYHPHIVDVLDVIGKHLIIAFHLQSILMARRSSIRSPSISLVDSHKRSEFAVRSESGAFAQPKPDVHSITPQRIV